MTSPRPGLRLERSRVVSLVEESSVCSSKNFGFPKMKFIELRCTIIISRTLLFSWFAQQRSSELVNAYYEPR